MTMRSTITACACALIASAAAAAADPPRSFRLDIAAGKVGEVCMQLDSGQSLSWRFKASREVDFNLHHHLDKEVLMPVALKALRQHAGTHAIDRRNDWCLMWTAPTSQPVTVEGRWSATRRAAPR